MTATSYDVVETLVANHRRFLSFLEKRVESREVAEDILHDAFVRGLDSQSLREADSAVAWFYRALRNAVVDHYRRRAVEAKALNELPVPDHDALMDTVCNCIADLLGTMRPEYAQAIRRVDLDGLKPGDYAEEAGMTANAARVRLFRAREALKRRLIQCCGTCAEHGCVECACRR